MLYVPEAGQSGHAPTRDGVPDGPRAARLGSGRFTRRTDRPLRIMHVAEAFGGGLLEMVCKVAEGAAAAGHEVCIAYGRRPETPDQVPEIEGVELFELPWGERTLTEQALVASKLTAIVRRWQPEVVHLHSSVAGAVGTALLRPKPPTLIYSPHSYESAIPSSWARNAATRAVERRVVRNASIIGAVSPSEAELSKKRFGARRVVVVENGVEELEPDRILTRPLPQEPLVMSMGRTVPQRRPDAVARILSGLTDVAHVKWVGGGGGDRGRSGKSALEDAGVPVTGWLPRAEAVGHLEQATAYLHWTHWDGQPLCVLEALARDAVVIASDIPPNRDILGPRQVFKTEDDAVAALRRVVLDPEYAEALRAAQRERRERWAASRMIDDWLAVYARCRRVRRSEYGPVQETPAVVALTPSL